MVPFIQYKKRDKHPWKSFNVSTKINTPPWVFFTFLKLCKRYQIAQRTTFSLSSYDGNLTTVEEALACLHESERYSVSHLGLLVSLSVFIAYGRSAGLGYYC